MAKSKKNEPQKTFNVGDRVTWSSQAAGSWKTKTGVIVAAVDPGQWITIDGVKRSIGTARHHIAVEVTTKHTRGERKDLYFPSTSALSLVTAAAAA